MRYSVGLTLVVAGILAFAGNASADDETQALIEKAIKAHGGREKLSEKKTIQVKTKGTLEIMSSSLPFTQEMTIQPPKQLKEVIDLDVNGIKITVNTVFNDGKAWINANGKEVEVTDKIMEELKEGVYKAEVMDMVKLKDKKYELSSLGEVTVNDKKALGVKVACKGHKDLNIYFDKETGLITKVEGQALDSTTMQEVAEERIITEYQDVDGHKVAKKVLINRDGKKFMEAEVVEVKFVDKLDDSHFGKP
ncbi:MAG TPA: hypothetical protein VGZ25_01915 [Gemmataceae bacterium]|jgi:hypothetical protein|nr:hypothetical protein [Gemmataceae bacterium]